MNLWRRIVGLSLSAVMALSLLAPAAHAEETEPAVTEEMSVVQLAEEQQGEDAVLTKQAEMAEEEPALPEEQPTEAEECADPTEEEPAEAEEIAAVRVSFVCEPEELTLTVYPAVSFGEREAIQPEEDGTYLLMPGDYLYTAECELWETAENVEFTVEQGEENVILNVLLAPCINFIFEQNALSVTYSSSNFIPIWPVKNGNIINSLDSYFNGGNHNGIDIMPNNSQYANQEVYAIADGTVVEARNSCNHVNAGASHACPDTWGNYICIKHSVNGKTYYSVYAHLNYNSIAVSAGSTVSAGQRIANMGSSGGSSAYHLHLEIWEGDRYARSDGRNAYSFDYYKNNIDSIVGIRFHSGLVTYSSRYSSWILSNCDYANGYYVVKDPSYLSKCTYYPCYVQVTPANGLHEIWSQPCDNNTDPDSRVIYNTTGTLTAIALYKNTVTTSDHYWYKVKIGVETPSGETEGYVYAPYCNVKTVNTTIKNGLTYKWDDIPSTLTVGNKGYPVKCTVYSQYADISTITGAIGGYKGIENYGQQAKVREKYLYSTSVDTGMRFDAITAPGNYALTLSVLVNNYYCTSKTNTLKSETITKTLINQSVTYIAAGASNPCASGHTWNSGTVTTQPTCTAEGAKTYTCTKCSATKTEAIPAKGHTAVTDPAVAATCTTAGKSAGSHCSVCNAVITAQSTVAALGHNFSLTETHNGSCTERPYNIYTCTRCGETAKDYTNNGWSEWSTDKPDNIDEQYIETLTQYRYKDKETTTYTSSTLSGWTLSGTKQVWGEYSAWSDWQTSSVTASDSTQVESATVWGYYYYTCPSCGRHMHVRGTNACYTWAGGCGASIPDNFIGLWSTTSWDNANLKDWYGTGRYYTSFDGVGTVFKWSDNGTPRTGYRYRTRSMTTVYEFYRWTDWSAWSLSPVTANENRQVETRTLYRYDLFATASHSWDSGKVTKAATCTATGVKTYTCTKCGETKTETIAKKGHTVVEDPAVAATCTAAGKTAGSHCSVCNAVITAQTTVQATGHSWDSGKVTKAATCTATGVKTYTCTVCGATKTETIAKKGHNYVATVTPPTATEQGYTTHICSRCGDKYIDSFVDPTGNSETLKSDFITRLYNVCLGRNPSAQDLADSITQLKNGTTGAQKAYQFIFSDEFKSKNYCDEHYVRALYKAFMGREASADEAASWVWRLQQGDSRETVFNYFANCAEFGAICSGAGITQGKASYSGSTKQGGYCSATGCTAYKQKVEFVTRLYNVCLDRNPNQSEKDAWHYYFVHGDHTGSSASEYFLTSKEFKAHNYNNADFIKHVFSAMLGRAPSESELSSWEYNMWANNKSRVSVIREFTKFDEFKAICQQYGIVHS